MYKLITLEMKKFRLNGFVKGAFIANLVIIASIAFFNFAEQSEGLVAFQNFDEAFAIIETMVRITFVIFAAVLLGRMVIGEYNTRTISLLFTYPVNRKKMMTAKLIIVGLFTFSSILISNLIVGTGFYLLDSYFRYVPEPLSAGIVNEWLIRMSIGALVAACISFVPLYIGMKRKSVPATIVTSFLLIGILSSNTEGFSLFSIIAIPIFVGLLGLWIAYLSIRNIEQEDI